MVVQALAGLLGRKSARRPKVTHVLTWGGWGWGAGSGDSMEGTGDDTNGRMHDSGKARARVGGGWRGRGGAGGGWGGREGQHGTLLTATGFFESNDSHKAAKSFIRCMRSSSSSICCCLIRSCPLTSPLCTTALSLLTSLFIRTSSSRYTSCWRRFEVGALLLSSSALMGRLRRGLLLPTGMTVRVLRARGPDPSKPF